MVCKLSFIKFFLYFYNCFKRLKFHFFDQHCNGNFLFKQQTEEPQN